MTSTFSCFASRVYPLIVQFSLSLRLNLSFSKAFFLKSEDPYLSHTYDGRWIKKPFRTLRSLLFQTQFNPNPYQWAITIKPSRFKRTNRFCLALRSPRESCLCVIRPEIRRWAWPKSDNIQPFDPRSTDQIASTGYRPASASPSCPLPHSFSLIRTPLLVNRWAWSIWVIEYLSLSDRSSFWNEAQMREQTLVEENSAYENAMSILWDKDRREETWGRDSLLTKLKVSYKI